MLSFPLEQRYLGFFRVKRGDGQHSEVQYFVRDREGRDVLAVVVRCATAPRPKNTTPHLKLHHH